MTIELTTAARVLATLRARNAVKDQIRRQGLKVHQYTAREITGWANVYLDEHPELIPEAMANARAMILKGLLGKRAQRQLRAKIESDAQSKIERFNGFGCADVWQADRLARSTRDLLNTLATIAEAGATFKSLGDPWCDTTTPHGELMVTILGGLATFERHLILARTDEGRKRAQARGVRFGRKPKLTVHQQREAQARRAAGEPLVEIARSYAVSHSTISRLA